MRDLAYVFSFSNFIMAIALLKYNPDMLFIAWLLFPAVVVVNMIRLRIKKWV